MEKMKQRKANQLSSYETTNNIYSRTKFQVLSIFGPKIFDQSFFLVITHCADLAWNLMRCPTAANHHNLGFYWPVRRAASGTSGSRCTTTRLPALGGRRTCWTSKAWIESWHPVWRSPSYTQTNTQILNRDKMSSIFLIYCNSIRLNVSGTIFPLVFVNDRYESKRLYFVHLYFEE